MVVVAGCVRLKRLPCITVRLMRYRAQHPQGCKAHRKSMDGAVCTSALCQCTMRKAHCPQLVTLKRGAAAAIERKPQREQSHLVNSGPRLIINCVHASRAEVTVQVRACVFAGEVSHHQHLCVALGTCMQRGPMLLGACWRQSIKHCKTSCLCACH